jgi:hypothetical protein
VCYFFHTNNRPNSQFLKHTLALSLFSNFVLGLGVGQLMGADYLLSTLFGLLGSTSPVLGVACVVIGRECGCGWRHPWTHVELGFESLGPEYTRRERGLEKKVRLLASFPSVGRFESRSSLLCRGQTAWWVGFGFAVNLDRPIYANRAEPSPV